MIKRNTIVSLACLYTLICLPISKVYAVNKLLADTNECEISNEATFYSVLIDGNDCNRCTMLVRALKEKNRSRIKYIYFQNVPTFGRQDLLNQIGFYGHDFQVLNGNDCIDKHVATINRNAGERSGVIKYSRRSKNFEYKSFKKLANMREQEKFFRKESAEVKRTILDYKKFFSYASNFTKFNSKFVVSTNASVDLPVFSDTGSLFTTLSIDTTHWRKFYLIYYEEILADSLKSLNSDSISLALYHSYMKKIGQGLWAYQSSFLADSQLVCVANVYFPINVSEEKVRHDGAEFLLIYNKEFKLVDYYLIPRGRLPINYNAAAFNGAGFQNTFFKLSLYPADKFSMRDINPVSVPFKKSKNHVLEPVKSSMPSLKKELILSYNKEATLFRLKHKYTETDYLYFEKLPLVMDKSGRLLTIDLPDSLIGFTNFFMIEGEDCLFAALLHNKNLKLVKLTLADEGDKLIISDYRALDIIPETESLQCILLTEDRCYILSLNDTVGLILNEVEMPFDF